MELDQDRKEKVGGPEHANWDDSIANQLEALLLGNLHLIFQCAHKVISDSGFDEKDAEKAISRAGLYVGDKDPIIKIVNDSLAFLKGEKDADTSFDEKFEELEHLTEYTMLEMINVLREVRPFLSVGEAMWWLLICDLNVLQACKFEVDSLSDSGSKEETLEDKYLESISCQLTSEAQNHLPEMMKFGNFLKHTQSRDTHAPEGTTRENESFSSMLDHLEKCLDTIGEHLRTITQTTASKVKPEVGQKGRPKRDIATLLQKPYHLGRNCKTYMAKGRFKSGKLVIDKRSKYLSELPGVTLKVGRSGINAELGAKAPLAFGTHPVPTNKPSTSLETTVNSAKLPGKGTISSLATEKAKLLDTFPSGEKSDSNSQDSTSSSLVIFDDCAGIPYDKSSEKYIPHDEKDELIVQLVSRLQEVQNQLEGWTKWANQKVMLAARRLTKDQLELKTLRQESEPEQVFPWGRIMKKLSDNITKRLSDMENALNNITAQLDNGRITIDRLEVEKSMLKKDVEVAKSKALESAASYQEALERENKARKEVESWEEQNGLLHQELEMEKNNMAALQQDLGKAKNTLHQIEDSWKQEKREKEKLLAQAASVKNKREQIQAKAEQESIKQKARSDAQSKKLERIISEAMSKSDTSIKAAPKGGTSRSFGTTLMERKSFIMMKGRDNFKAGSLRQDRECAMCLSEESSVVFLPCSHQVVCSKCNEIHEKGGMKDCPSCRATIAQRINVRFAQPFAHPYSR